MESFIKKIFRRTIYCLLSVLLPLAIIVAVLGWQLKKGIEIDQFAFFSVRLEKILLRLDKGIVLHVEYIDVTSSSVDDNDFNALDTWMPGIKKWSHLIQELDIGRLDYKDHSLSILYRDNTFQVRNDTFTLDSRITYEKGAFSLNFSKLEIIPYKVSLRGEAVYYRKEDRIDFSGTFQSPWCSGGLQILEQDGNVRARITTDVFTDLSGLLAQFPIDADVRAWIAENIYADTYRIDELNLNFSLDNFKDFGPENIHGTAQAQGVDIRFDPDLPLVKTDSVAITYRKDRLCFALENPWYIDKDLEGSKVFINNLTKADPTLAIIITTESRFDRGISALLDTYEIRVPLHQESGVTRARLNLLFTLPDFDFLANGDFETGSGNWVWRGIPLQAQGARVLLDNNEIIIHEADISIGENLKTKLSGTVNTVSKKAELITGIESLRVNAKGFTLLQADDLKMPLTIDFSHEPIAIDLDEINTSIAMDDATKVISIKNLNAVKPFAPLLQQVPFSGGNVRIDLHDMKDIVVSGEVDIPNKLLSLLNKPITHFDFQGSILPDKTEFDVNDGRITVEVADQIMVTLRDYLTTLDLDTIKEKYDNQSSVPFNLSLKGPETLIRIKDFQVSTKYFEYKMFGPDLKFEGVLEKGHFEYSRQGGKCKFVGTDLDAQLADKFIPHTDLSEGLVNVVIEGDGEGYNGYLDFSNVTIKEYLLMHSLLTFINSIPALATFSETGFNQDGYQIREGIAQFNFQDNLLTIHQLRTDGITVNCEAKGWIDFKSEELNLNMELITLKDYSKIINIIPWAGYAILGEDGSLSTSLEITGTLSDPEIDTTLTEDIIMTPLNIVRRTLQWPIKLFIDAWEDEPEPPEQAMPVPMAPE